jgi:hypothetical protein
MNLLRRRPVARIEIQVPALEQDSELSGGGEGQEVVAKREAPDD